MWESALIERITRDYSVGYLRGSLVEDEGKRVFFSFLVLPICMGWIAQSYPWNQNVNRSMVYPITFQCFYQSTLCSYCHQPPTCCPCSYSPVSDRSSHTITHMTLFNSKLVTFLPSWRSATLLKAKPYLPRQWPTGLYAISLHLAMLAYPPSLPSSSRLYHHNDLLCLLVITELRMTCVYLVASGQAMVFLYKQNLSPSMCTINNFTSFRYCSDAASSVKPTRIP